MGSECLVAVTKERLGFTAKGHSVRGQSRSYELREGAAPCERGFDLERRRFGLRKHLFWDRHLLNISSVV